MQVWGSGVFGLRASVPSAAWAKEPVSLADAYKGTLVSLICFWLGHSCAQGFSNKTGSGREHAEDDGQDERAQITVAAPFRDLLLRFGKSRNGRRRVYITAFAEEPTKGAAGDIALSVSPDSCRTRRPQKVG